MSFLFARGNVTIWRFLDLSGAFKVLQEHLEACNQLLRITYSTPNGLALKPGMKILSYYLLQFVGFTVDKLAI
jgi:hypothetical protein